MIKQTITETNYLPAKNSDGTYTLRRIFKDENGKKLKKEREYLCKDREELIKKWDELEPWTEHSVIS